jgi:putative transposase
MHRAYTTRLKPTPQQAAMLAALLVQLCELYNMALQERRDAWKTCRKSLSRFDQQMELSGLREAFSEYGDMPAAIQRDPLRRLELAFAGFYRRHRSGEKAGYPRFRPSATYDSFSVDSQNFSIEGDCVRITKLGCFRFKRQRKMHGIPKVFRVKRVGGRWQCCVVCDIGPAPEKLTVSSAVGIDVGLTTLVTLSDGTEFANPRWTRREAGRLADANRSVARKVRGSKNIGKARERVRRCHQAIAGKRQRYLHGVSGALVKRYDLIAFEDLKIRNLVRSTMAKSITDAAWGQLLWQIKYKAESAGTYAVAVNPRGTSQRCSGCGATVRKVLSERTHSCLKCGLELGRDHNAAVNILRLGTSLALRPVAACSEGSI